MATTDIYGFEHENLDEARKAVETALGARLQHHDSTYLGEYCHGSAASGLSLKLRRNIDPMHQAERDPPEERFAEPDFPAALVLLYVSGRNLEPLRDALLRQAAGIAFLGRREAK